MPFFSYPLKSNPCSYVLNPSSSDPSKLLIPSYLDTFKVFLPTLYFSNPMNMFIIYFIVSKWIFLYFFYPPVLSYIFLPNFQKRFIFTKSKYFDTYHFDTYHSLINTLSFVFLPQKPPFTEFDMLLINKYSGHLPTAHLLS